MGAHEGEGQQHTPAIGLRRFALNYQLSPIEYSAHFAVALFQPPDRHNIASSLTMTR